MNMKLFTGVAFAALLVPVAAYAQETTTIIRGNVTSGGTPVADASVTITNVPSGTRSVTRTASDGSFTAPGLRAGGPFSVEVTSPIGNTTVTDIFTVVGQDYDLPIELAAPTGGSSGPDIVVTASKVRGAGVTSDGPQTVLGRRDISKVASVNRDVRDLERRDPFATLDLSNSRAVTFAGVNPRFNRFTVNGAAVGDNFGLNSDASPTRRGPVPLDAISQFSVSIAPYDFRQGNFVGGAIDTVLLSGTNKFHGTGFYSQNTDELSGKRIGSTTVTLPNYKSETYGATISGPIIKDKVFFMVSAERNKDPRPLTVAGIAQVPGLTQATVDAVSATARTRYGFDTGGIVSFSDNLDEKIVGRLDWNISDRQKLSLSYINAYDSMVTQNNSSNSTTNPALGYGSNYYTFTEKLRTGIAQLNSDWTDNFSTEARFIYKSSQNGRVPLGGQTGFAQFRVCTDPTSTGSTSACSTGVPTLAFGTEQFSQTNELFTDEYNGSILTRLTLGGHELKMLAEYDQKRTTNYFIPSSLGVYYFDSLADYNAGNASQLIYGTATQTPATSAAADFRFGQYTFGIQDDWRISSQLKVSYGFRYDLFAQKNNLVLNPNFVARYGYRNTQTYKGLENFQPRVGFDYKPTSNLSIRGGAGIFGGGSPDIYLSNSYGNTGILTNSQQLDRLTAVGGATATCTQTNVPVAACTGGLNNVNGTAVNSTFSNFVVNNNGSLTNAPTAELANNFRLPSVYKATLSADYKFFGINFGADYLFTRTRQGLTLSDLRSVVVGKLPDGRNRYAPLTSLNNVAGDANTDYVTKNTTQGVSHVFDVRFSKVFDWGLSFGGSYTRQIVKDVAPLTASQASSLYGQAAMSDPNEAAYGHGNDETRWAFKYNLGFDHAFFKDYRTVVQLFGETRAGRNYSFTMQATGSRSAVFGTPSSNTNAQTRFLLYVPTSPTDALVSYDTTATRDALDTLINGSALKGYRGKIAAKNIARSRAFTRIDLHLEQEIPTFLGRSRISIFGDIENLPNLLNRDWGGLRQQGFPYTSAVVQVTCLSAATPTGTAPGAGVTNTTTTQNCAQYRYSTYRAPNDAAISQLNSLYLIRIGARFTF